MASPYVSVFKIDGVPIMPPVMTTSRRAEMRLYREMAMKVEQRIAELLQKEESVKTIVPEPAPEPQPAPPVIPALPDYDFDETATSETLPNDTHTPVQIMPPDPQLSPPSVKDVLDLPSPKLIRSNSYTLDQPSPMLLKFLDSIGTNPAAAKKKLNKSACSTPKSPSPGNRKKTPRKLSDPAKLRSIYGIKKSPVRRGKHESLDDTKRLLTIHSKGEQVEKFFMKSKTAKDFENLTRKPNDRIATKNNHSSSSLSSPGSSPEKGNPNVHEEQQESCLNDSYLEEMQNGEEVQKKAMDQLNAHKQSLMHKLEDLNLMDRTSTPVQKRFQSEEDSHAAVECDPRLNETSFYSTIRADSPLSCSMSLVSDAYSKQYLHSIRSFAASPTLTPHHQEEEGEDEMQVRENMAATIINSHVRGYLIRRLLRTECVQNIIDNIRNVLFLILDATPNEIQLKRSYLMKLNGYCEALHNVFFGFSTKERMQVINKDRELLLARLSQRHAKRATFTLAKKVPIN